MDFGALEPSRIRTEFAGIELPAHYGWVRCSTPPFTEQLTPLQELHRAAAKLAEDIRMCPARGSTCSVCKAKLHGGHASPTACLISFDANVVVAEVPLAACLVQ